MTLRHLTARLVLFGIFSAIAGGAAAAPLWMDTPVARLEALTLIQTLNVEILSSTSATLTLERWCRDHALADTPVILAHRIENAAEVPSAAVRQDLQVNAHETVRYRRVELTCGDHVLSVADNWYVPARLTPQMNRLLETTQTPFGKVVQPLRPQRQTIAVQLLWAPLPEGWERSEFTSSPGKTPRTDWNYRRLCLNTAPSFIRPNTSPSPRCMRSTSEIFWPFRSRTCRTLSRSGRRRHSLDAPLRL